MLAATAGTEARGNISAPRPAICLHHGPDSTAAWPAARWPPLCSWVTNPTRDHTPCEDQARADMKTVPWRQGVRSGEGRPSRVVARGLSEKDRVCGKAETCRRAHPNPVVLLGLETGACLSCAMCSGHHFQGSVAAWAARPALSCMREVCHRLPETQREP